MTTPANPDDLIAFLRAQLDADAAEIAKHPDDYDSEAWDLSAEEETNYPCLPYLRIGKKRALAEVDATRRILDLHGHDGGGWDGEGKRCNECGGYDVVPGYGWKGYRRLWPCQTLKLLALPFADREGFREEWRA